MYCGDALYHYTTLAGFEGIITSKGFWASDTRFMNDAEEMLHGVELVASILEYKENKLRHSSFASVIKQVRLELLNSPVSGTFVACFSTVRDSLEQWRGYGGPGGICIGVGGVFQSEKTDGPRLRAPLFYAPSMLPIEVSYDLRSKSISILSVLRRFESEYVKDRFVMDSFWPDDHDNLYVKAIFDALKLRLVGFKNAAFSQELEARVVISQDQAESFGGLKFRASRFGLIPYVCTGAKLDGPVSIQNVMVGPSQHQDLVATSVRTFLDHHGYDDVPVDLSKVPFRSP